VSFQTSIQKNPSPDYNWSIDRLVQSALRRFIKRGNLLVKTPRGFAFALGDGNGEQITVRIRTTQAVRRLLSDPEVGVGECYMNGTLVMEHGTISDLLALLLRQNRNEMLPFWAKPQWLVRYLWRRAQQWNGKRRSRNNATSHYDADERLYRLFLDNDRQYSCAYFETPDQSLDDAQLAKKRHLAAKTLLQQPGKTVLDIGCGWGGLALYLAQYCDAKVTGITLSQNQFNHALKRAEAQGLSDRVRFRLLDYRDAEGPFDRIVSVGMFEHVGLNFYNAFFSKCADLLAEDGIMLLHSIGRSEGPNITNPWIAKYIFPGGYIPSLSEFVPSIERAGLLVTDIEILRLHYAETLKAWRERFLAHAEDVRRIYDERFLRMWEFYLACSEMAFREQAMMVMQIQLTKRQNIVPMTRDYIGHEEARLRVLEARSRAGVKP